MLRVVISLRSVDEHTGGTTGTSKFYLSLSILPSLRSCSSLPSSLIAIASPSRIEAKDGYDRYCRQMLPLLSSRTREGEERKKALYTNHVWNFSTHRYASSVRLSINLDCAHLPRPMENRVCFSVLWIRWPWSLCSFPSCLLGLPWCCHCSSLNSSVLCKPPLSCKLLCFRVHTFGQPSMYAVPTFECIYTSLCGISLLCTHTLVCYPSCFSHTFVCAHQHSLPSHRITHLSVSKS